MALSTDNGTVFNPILDTALPWMQSLEKTKKAKLSNAMTNSLILCYDSSEITTKFIWAHLHTPDLFYLDLLT